VFLFTLLFLRFMGKSLQRIAAVIFIISTTTVQAQTASRAVPGQVVIKYKTARNFLAAAASLETFGIDVVKSLPELAVVVGEFSPKKNIEDMVRACKALPNVEYAEPNYYVHALGNEPGILKPGSNATATQPGAIRIPNDPRFGEQWSLNNSNDADIDAPEAWDIQIGNAEVIVGIVDTGIDYNHEDLQDNIWRNPGESGGGKESNGVDDDGNGYIDDWRGWDFANGDNDPNDDNGSGTHAAGIIGATGNNAKGIAGVNWRVQLTPLKFLRGEGSGTTEDAIEAIVYAAKMGIKILCNNWGGNGNSRALQDAIQYASDNGVLFIATAGRAGIDVDTTPTYPSGYDLPNIIAVTSSDRDDKLIGNFGRRSVDLAAPGLSILSAQPLNRYQSLSTGATPQVAGVCALVWAQYPNLKLQQVINRVLGSVDRKTEFINLMTTAGRLNAANALSTNPIIAGTTALENTTDTSGPYFIRTSVIDDGAVSRTQLIYTVNEIYSDTLDMELTPNDEYLARISGQPWNTTVRYLVVVEDNQGNRATSPAFSFSISAIAAPVFDFRSFPRVTNDPKPVFHWENIADAKAYEVSLAINPEFSLSFTEKTASPNYTAPSPLLDGKWYIRIRAVSNADISGPWSAGEIFTVDTAAPTDVQIEVNAGAVYANSCAVTLLFDAFGVRPGVDSVRFANGDETEEPQWTLFEDRTRAWQLAKGKDGPRQVYIQFKDRAQNFSEPDSAGIFLDTAPPVFASASLRITPAQPGLGDTVRIVLEPPQDDSGIKRFDLFYRRAGENWRSVPLRNNSAQIPPEFITARGVDFKIAAEDSAGNLGCFRNGRLNFFSLPVAVPPGGAGSFPGSPGGTTAAAYRLVSLPLIVANPAVSEVFTNLGAYGVKRDYRFWRLEADRQWHEEDDQLKVQLGESYFLITRQSKRLSNKSAGVTAQAADGALGNFVGWRLRANDWTLIGNPFNFEIALEDLRLKNKNMNLRLDSTQKVWSYNGEWEMNPVRLEKWSGLAVRNTGAADTLLYLPPLDDASPGSTIAEKNTLHPSNAGNEWLLPVRAESRAGRDHDNYLGVRQGAKAGRDEFDYIEPPLLPGGLSLSFFAGDDERHKNLAVDIRPPQQQGHEWILLIQSPGEDVVKLHFENLEKLPPELEIWLVDDALKITQNLRESNRYAVAGSEQPKPLKLVVGKHEFVGEKLASVQLIPTTYELSQNFPNPFNPATTIRYGLPKAERVTLKIYNLLGEEVATLVHDEQKAAGYHAAVWDGRNKNGRVVASGVYVYRMQAGSFVMTKKLALVK